MDSFVLLQSRLLLQISPNNTLYLAFFYFTKICFAVSGEDCNKVQSQDHFLPRENFYFEFLQVHFYKVTRRFVKF